MRIIATAFLTCALFSATAHADNDLRSKDLAGIRLGMSQAEVAAVYKDIEKTQPHCTLRNNPGGNAYPHIGMVQSIDCSGQDSQYNVQSYLSTVSGRVAHIHFINYNPGKRLDIAKFMSQLEGKYGPPTLKPSAESRSWYTDDNGKTYPLNAAGHYRQCTEVRGPHGDKVDDQCNVVVSASASTDQSSKRTSRQILGYTIVMTDHHLIAEGSRKPTAAPAPGVSK